MPPLILLAPFRRPTTRLGAFAEWWLPKQLLIPFAEQLDADGNLVLARVRE